MFSNSDIKFYLSGGEANKFKSLSLGGSISNTTISDNINNLFAETTKQESRDGSEKYRCFYIVNESDEILRFTSLSAEETSYCIGIDQKTEIQTITLSGFPVGGSFVIAFRASINGETSVDLTDDINFSPNPTTQATAIQNALNALPHLPEVQVSGSVSFNSWNYTVNFSEYRKYDLLEIAANDLLGSSSFEIKSTVNGGPINAIATDIGIENLVPTGVSFASEFEIGDLQPLDAIAVWLRRIIPIRTVSIGDIDSIDFDITFNIF